MIYINSACGTTVFYGIQAHVNYSQLCLPIRVNSPVRAEVV